VIALGIMRPDLRESFENRSEELIEIVKLGIFAVCGSLLTFSALFTDGWVAVAIVAVTLLVVRPLSIFVSLIGVRLSVPVSAWLWSFVLVA
jgi:NhaP-type Na+/H+ or K+/H+ antiporter